MRRLAVATLLLACSLAAQVEPAAACSCAIGDARRALARADAAFIGVLIDKRVSGPAAIYTFRVAEAVKGKLGETIEVDSAADGAACGIEAQTGVPIGLFLDRAGGRWTSTLCAQIGPAALRRAATLLPAPTGSGPVALLVGGSFGKARLLALDRRGRTLAYGYGSGETSLLSVCPGAARFAELVWDHPRVRIAVRNLRTLERVRELPVPQSALDQPSAQPVALSCRDARGSELLVFSHAELASRIVRIRASSFSVVYSGRARQATFAGAIAYLVEGTRLIRLDLGTGRRSRAAVVPEWTGPVSISPDGSRAVGISVPPPLDRLTPPPHVVLVDLTGSGPRVRTRSLGRSSQGGDVHWLGRERILFLPSGGDRDLARVYDTRLRARSSFVGWFGSPSAVAGGVAYGLTYTGALRSAKLPGGPARTVRTFPSPVLRSIVAVPR